MIIERQYEWIGVLYENDQFSKKIIDDAFNVVEMSTEEKDKLLQYNYYNILAFCNLGSGIPSKCYSYIMNEFKKIDSKNPYDNGLTFMDISKIEFETSRKGNAIQLRFVREACGQPYRIIGFASIENKNNSMRIGEGWRMTPPLIIG